MNSRRTATVTVAYAEHEGLQCTNTDPGAHLHDSILVDLGISKGGFSPKPSRKKSAP